MAFPECGPGGEQAARGKRLAQLLGIEEDQAADTSLAGRLAIIAKLKAARAVEIARGRSGSWLYDLNRHLSLCSALRHEYESFALFCAEAASQERAAAPEAGAAVLPFPPRAAVCKLKEPS
jgi:hypothetical protein